MTSTEGSGLPSLSLSASFRYHIVTGQADGGVGPVSASGSLSEGRPEHVMSPVGGRILAGRTFPMHSTVSRTTSRLVIARLACLLLLAAVGLMHTGCANFKIDREEFKAGIKREILAELRESGTLAEMARQAFTDQERARITAEVERGVLAKLSAQIEHYQAVGSGTSTTAGGVDLVTGPAGSAEGRVVRNDEGLPGCRIKLVRIMRGAGVVDMLRVYEEGAEFLTVTDEDGRYRFDHLPVGAYKVKWQLPGDTGWIRRLRDEPDVTVEAGKNATMKDIKAHVRLVPH